MKFSASLFLKQEFREIAQLGENSQKKNELITFLRAGFLPI